MMLSNYLKTTIRSLQKQKFYALINLLGLAVGMTASLMILLYVANDLSYDRFHRQIDQIYLIGLHGKLGDQELHTANTCAPMMGALVTEYPEVVSATQTTIWKSVVLQFDEQSVTVPDVAFADSNFFEVFDFALVAGNPETVFKEINQMVMTPAMAKNLFGKEDPIGKIVSFSNDKTAVKVVGVIEPAPANSHFRFDVIVSMDTHPYHNENQWTSNSFYTYALLEKGTDVAAFNKKLEELVVKYVGPELMQFLGISLEQFRQNGGMYGYFTVPLGELYLNSGDLTDTPEALGDIQYVYIFTIIGVFILLLACINFMNLSTARSAGRAKEIGVRKVMGAYRSRLILQFIVESTLYAIMAMAVAVIATYLLLPYFNTLSGKELNLSLLATPLFWAGVVGIAALVGLLAGSYPAFYLSAFQPVVVLKGKLKSGMKGSKLRNALVVFQFAVSIGLMVCTSVVFKQLQFVQEKNLGFDKDHIMILLNSSRLHTNAQPFMAALRQDTRVVGVTRSNDAPPAIGNTTVFRALGNESDFLLAQYYADEHHLPTMGYQLTAGRNFTDSPADSLSVIVNEAAVQQFGFTDPIGQQLQFYGRSENGEHMTIVGVVKDFHFETLKDQIRPLVIVKGDFGNVISINLGNTPPSEMVEMVEQKWKEMASGEPFEFRFLDQEYDQLFRAEQRLGKVFSMFTALAIFVACLGLLGLATFTGEQRTKEIGIRKVLGAPAHQLVMMLTREFTWLVVIAFVLVAPVSGYLMHRWLEGFAYRIDISWDTILPAGIAALLIAWGTVLRQAVKTSQTNPAQTLKTE